MKPMIKYRGGKSKEIPRLMHHIPQFQGRYIEPFLGGGAMFFHLEPQQAIINDINPKLMEFYRGVRDNYLHLRRELDEIEHIYTANRAEFDAMKARFPDERVPDTNEEMYYHLRAMFNDLQHKDYSDALLYYYINKTSYSGMIRYNARGEFNVPFGRYTRLNTSAVTQRHSELLGRAQLFNTDYAAVFEMCRPDDFVFLDPPYDCVFSDYGNHEYQEDFTEESHRRLANDFFNLPCMALMVIGATPLTTELYHNNIVDEYEKNYAVNIRNRFRAGANHIIVTNYQARWLDRNPARYLPQPQAQMFVFEAEQQYGTN